MYISPCAAVFLLLNRGHAKVYYLVLPGVKNRSDVIRSSSVQGLHLLRLYVKANQCVS